MNPIDEWPIVVKNDQSLKERGGFFQKDRVRPVQCVQIPESYYVCKLVDEVGDWKEGPRNQNVYWFKVVELVQPKLIEYCVALNKY